MIRFILFFCLGFSFTSSTAQFDHARMDSLFFQLDTHHKAMLSANIHEKGTSIYSKAIGFSDVENKKLANTQTIYHIGSISKMFTAVIIFQLIDEKKLSLNDHLSKFYPEIPNSAEITIAQLLNHHSGIFNITNDPTFMSFMHKTMDEAALIKLIAGYKPSAKPGLIGAYSNTNYILLSLVIEKVAKNNLATELQDRICQKIGLENTRIAEMTQAEKNEAKSYFYADETWVDAGETNMSIPRGAGAIQSTPEELCKFIEALFEGKLMSSASFDEMMKMEDGFGKGIIAFPFGSKKAFGHNGSINGYKSVLGYFPEDKMSFSIIGNGFDFNINSIVIGLLSIYYQKPYTIPTFSKKKPLPSSLKTIEGVYSNDKISMKISIEREGEQWFAQATGQKAFPMTKRGELEYVFEEAGAELIFKKEPNGHIKFLTLKQKGAVIIFEKE